MVAAWSDRARFKAVGAALHGSLLNIAELELSVLSRQCLDRRIAAKEELAAEVHSWLEELNSSTVGVDWQFMAADARVKLKRHYPDP